MSRKPRRYLTLKSNTYWFKRDIPAAIRDQFEGATAYLKNLHTGDIREAQGRRDQVEKECDREFAEARSGRLTFRSNDPVRALGEAWAAEMAASRKDPADWTARLYGRDVHDLEDEDVEAAEHHIPDVAHGIEAQYGKAGAERFLNIAYGRHPAGHYVDAYLSEVNLAPKTSNERRGLIRRFAAWADGQGLVLPDINRALASQYVAAHIAPLHRRTAKKHLTALRGYWEHLKRRSLVGDGTIWADQLAPDRGRRAERADQETERPFTEAEIAKLLYSRHPTNALRGFEQQISDGMHIAALSGMRLAEIVTLHVGECRGGAFAINQGKTLAAVRHVPIHPALSEIVARRTRGKADNEWLFDELSRERDPGDVFGKRFKRFREALGVDDVRVGKRRSLVNFHSFRRWFITKAEHAGQPQSTISAVVGHSEGRKSVTFSVYSHGPSEAQRRACVEAVDLPRHSEGR